jgi:hypothetical protein
MVTKKRGVKKNNYLNRFNLCGIFSSIFSKGIRVAILNFSLLFTLIGDRRHCAQRIYYRKAAIILFFCSEWHPTFLAGEAPRRCSSLLVYRAGFQKIGRIK